MTHAPCPLPFISPIPKPAVAFQPLRAVSNQSASPPLHVMDTRSKISVKLPYRALGYCISEQPHAAALHAARQL